MEGEVLEGDISGFFGETFVDDGISLLDDFDVVNFLDLGLNEELIFLFIHYFI